jgi:hypothetical protein
MIEPVEVECDNCKSIISFTYEDVKREEVTNLFGNPVFIKRFIICPVCKDNIYIKHKEDEGDAE